MVQNKTALMVKSSNGAKSIEQRLKEELRLNQE